MTGRTASRLAGLAFVVGAVVSVAAGALQYVTRDVPVDYYAVRGFQGVFGLVIMATAWLIVSRRPGNPIGWIFLVAGIVSTVQAFASSYGTYSISHHQGTLPLTTLVTWLSVWVWAFIIGPMATFVPLLFPSGKLETRGQRRLAVFSAFAVVVFAGTVAVTPGQSGEMPRGVDNPYAVSAETADALSPLMVLFAIAALSCMYVLMRRFRRATGETRQQMKWLTFAGSLAAVALVVQLVQLTLVGATAEDLHSLALRIPAMLVIIGFGGIPVACGLAIVRYGLYDIDVVINKTIVYTLIAAFISAVYAGVVIGVGHLVGSGSNTALSIVATAIVALAVQPVRARAQHLANRMVFGKRSTPYEALSEFSARLAGGVEAEDVLPRLARLMTEATAAERASVWLAVGDLLRPAAAWPADVHPEPLPCPDEPFDLPGWGRAYAVRHEGELLGALAVATRAGEPLTPTEERLLSDLASQAGLLLRNARLIEELRASRQRLVAAQDLERRRIERNIHDGAQQQLVALAVTLQLAETLLDDDREQARQMLQRSRTDVHSALEDLRALAHGIYPPVLAERGLVAALESQAARAALPVTVEAVGLERYPQEVESAVYFCVLEALQNVSKYAGASSVVVRLRATDGEIAFDVTDDGHGFDVRTVERGMGLTNMADRLDAIGGRLDITSAPGSGTTVSGRITLEHAEP